jgi:hypothetical protein
MIQIMGMFRMRKMMMVIVVPVKDVIAWMMIVVPVV